MNLEINSINQEKKEVVGLKKANQQNKNGFSDLSFSEVFGNFANTANTAVRSNMDQLSKTFFQNQNNGTSINEVKDQSFVGRDQGANDPQGVNDSSNKSETFDAGRDIKEKIAEKVDEDKQVEKTSKNEILEFLRKISGKKEVGQLSWEEKLFLGKHQSTIDKLMPSLQLKNKNQLAQLVNSFKQENVEFSEMNRTFLKDIVSEIKGKKANLLQQQTQTSVLNADEPANFTLIRGINEATKTKNNGLNRSSGSSGPSGLRQGIENINTINGGEEINLKAKPENTVNVIRRLVQNSATNPVNGKNFVTLKPTEFATTIKQLTGGQDGREGIKFQLNPGSNTLQNTRKLSSNQVSHKLNIKALIQELGSNIRQAVVNGKEIMTVRLRPESLGKVNITLTKSNENLSVKLSVESHLVKESLDLRINDLRESLVEQGLNNFSLEVNVSHSGQQGLQTGMGETKANSERVLEIENSVEQSVELVDLRENARLNIRA